MAEVLAFRVPAGTAHTLLVWGLEPAPGLEVRLGLGLGPGPGPPRVPPGLGSGVGTPWVPPRLGSRVGLRRGLSLSRPKAPVPPSALGHFSHHLPCVLIRFLTPPPLLFYFFLNRVLIPLRHSGQL